MQSTSNAGQHRIEIIPTAISQLENIHFPAKQDHALSRSNPLELAPIKYEVKGLNRKVYLSDIYSHSHYPIMFAYIKDDEGNYQTRFFYFSHSHSVWRVAPVAGQSKSKMGAVKGGFGKGYGEFSCDLPTNFNLAMLKQFNGELLNPSAWIENDNIAMLIDAFSESPGIVPDASANFLSETKSPTHSQPIYSYEEGEDPTFVRQADALTVIDESDLPDVKALQEFDFVNPYYNEFNNADYPLKLYICSSINGKYHFLFLESSLKENLIDEKKDKPGPCYFLLTVSKSDEQINSFGVSPKSVNLGYLHVTPLMREHDVKMLVSASHPIMKNARRVVLHETSNYLNLAVYSAALPINQYLKSMLAPRKTKQLGKHASMRDKTSTLFQPNKEKEELSSGKPKARNKEKKQKTKLLSLSILKKKEKSEKNTKKEKAKEKTKKRSTNLKKNS